MKVCIDTLGCRTNLADSSALARRLVSCGVELVTQVEEADLLVVNSCTVTHGADRDVRKTLRRAVRSNSRLKTLVTGCLPSAYPEHPALELADDFSAGADLSAIVRKILNLLGRQELEVAPPDGLVESFPLEEAGSLARFHVKVGQGCDHGCTYCIVPSARGVPVSRAPGDILKEVRLAAARGFEEVVITATHLLRYGEDQSPRVTLGQLIEHLEEVPEPLRYRLCSLEPEEGLEDLVAHVAASTRWCRHFHVSIQSACDETLARMGRRYRFQRIEDFLNHTRSRLPMAGIGLDVIVGFPGETAKDFEAGFENLSRLPFSYLHVFSFSSRPGTVASRNLWPEVPSAQVRERVSRLSALSQQRREAFATSLVGQEVLVLVENRRTQDGDSLMGLSDNYLRVELSGGDEWMQRRVSCQVVGTRGETLLAEINPTQET